MCKSYQENHGNNLYFHIVCFISIHFYSDTKLTASVPKQQNSLQEHQDSSYTIGLIDRLNRQSLGTNWNVFGVPNSSVRTSNPYSSNHRTSNFSRRWFYRYFKGYKFLRTNFFLVIAVKLSSIIYSNYCLTAKISSAKLTKYFESRKLILWKWKMIFFGIIEEWFWSWSINLKF